MSTFHVPDSGIRFFSRLSGFSKSAYLESTCYGEFPDAKIFPDKICPGSGFARKLSFSAIFLNFSSMSTQNNKKLRFLCLKLFPDAKIQIFCQNSGFSKSAYLEPTSYGEFTGSGFAQKWSFLKLFLNLSLLYVQKDQKIRFLCPYGFL